MKYTPGPWRVEDIGVIEGLAIMAPDRPGRTNEYRTLAFACCDKSHGILLQDAEANANLIAAAPALYAALKAVVACLSSIHAIDKRACPNIKTARAALALAEGQPSPDGPVKISNGLPS